MCGGRGMKTKPFLIWTLDGLKKAERYYNRITNKGLTPFVYNYNSDLIYIGVKE